MFRRPQLIPAWYLLLFLSLGRCALFDAQKSNDALATLGTIQGSLVHGPPKGAATFVVLLEDDGAGSWRTYSNRLLYSRGTFEFLVRKGRWRVFAFVDVNADLTWNPSEPSAEGPLVLVAAGATVTLPPLETRPEGPTPPVAIQVATQNVAEELVQVHRGDTATLDDERLSRAAGELGYWQPAEFALKYGIGVSFLEAFDEQRIPVLFVHGAEGAPSNFATIIQNLDRSRFQPWVYSYPSGIRLQLAATTLTRIMDWLQRQLGFQQLVVVAHSMGGLVARTFVATVSNRPDHHYVKLFVSISSPFGGIEAARSGVKHSPVVVPSWLDVARDSPFLEALQTTSLPGTVPHHLFFGYVGGTNEDGPTDGTLSVRSLLHPALQQDATKIRGFPVDHQQVLTDPDVVNALNASLNTLRTN